jgi:ubiquinone/menaquinone biosynthesis C-methylase UbiE
VPERAPPAFTGIGASVDFASKSALYFDTIAPRYDEQLSKDAWTRSAFHGLVMQYVPAGSLLLDFGCGTGTDAFWYTKQGLRVIACDVSSGMLAELEKKCRAEIANGQVTTYHADYEGLLQLPLTEKPLAVVCNFAVLSLIPDLKPTFAAFANYVSSEGYVVVSMLNPMFWRAFRDLWWWKAVFQSIGKGRVRVQGVQHDTYRYFVGTMDAAAAPHFKKIDQASVDAVIRSASCQHDWSTPATLLEKLEKIFWKMPLLRGLGRFVFVVYRRCA